jgi:hypothetical protein
MPKKKEPAKTVPNAYGYVPDGGKAAMGDVINYQPKTQDGVDNRPPVGGHKYSDWELPVCETDKDRRTFPGWYVLEPDPKYMDDISNDGTTETRGGNKTNKAVKAQPVHQMPRRFGKPHQSHELDNLKSREGVD